MLSHLFSYALKMLDEAKYQKYFSKKYAPNEFKVQSAGTKPISEINPNSIEAIKELGIDINTQKAKEITDEMIRNSEYIINMGWMDISSYPTLFLPKL
ncbi:MAG TPA: hypothetical protein VJ697_13880 [Nitrososphaeraceae archaeon]|nr:hypothetical protein [Nitrososphaeraceae archaeon]